MSRKKIFQELADNLALVSEQIKNDRTPRTEKEVSLPEFWKRFEEATKAVASECTKLSLAFSSAPVPSSAGCASFRERVEGVTLTLVSVVYRLPSDQGRGVRNKVFDITMEIVGAVMSLVQVIGEHAEGNHQEALQCTGGVWDLCDCVPTLPRDNRQLTLHLTKQSLDLVKDALSEIEDEINNSPGQNTEEINEEEDFDDISDEVTWSEEEKKLLNPAIGLIKVTKSALKKLHDSMRQSGLCDSSVAAGDYDVIIARLHDISPHVDDVIETLYPPVIGEKVTERTEHLVNTVKSLLEVLPGLHFVGEGDATWRDFLVKACDHNWTKLQQVLSGT